MAERRFPAVVDGALAPDGRISLEVMGAGFQHGEGLFETLPVVGGRTIFLDRHLQRLRQGAAALGLEDPGATESWRKDLSLLVGAAGGEDLAVRLFLVRDGARVRRVLGATHLPDEDHPAVLDWAAPRFQSARGLAGLKTMNYLGNRLAHAEGIARGCDEVIFHEADGTVLEGSRSTIFAVRGGVVQTPSLDLPILPGVTRAVLLEGARAAGIPVEERHLMTGELLVADELFLTSSLRGVRPIQALHGRTLPGVPGPVTRSLREIYRRALEAEAERDALP